VLEKSLDVLLQATGAVSLMSVNVVNGGDSKCKMCIKTCFIKLCI